MENTELLEKITGIVGQAMDNATFNKHNQWKTINHNLTLVAKYHSNTDCVTNDVWLGKNDIIGKDLGRDAAIEMIYKQTQNQT